jgi:hypothetical protein
LLRHVRIQRLRSGCLAMTGGVFSLQKTQVQRPFGRLEGIPQYNAESLYTHNSSGEAPIERGQQSVGKRLVIVRRRGIK